MSKCFFQIEAPSDPSSTMIFKISFCTIPVSFHVNLSFSGFVILEKKYFKSNHHISAFLQLSPLYIVPRPLFVQTSIPLMQRWFVPSSIEIGRLVLERKIFSNIETCKNVFPHCGPTRPLLTMFCTILNLHISGSF
jgi:hypothetical protein